MLHEFINPESLIVILGAYSATANLVTALVKAFFSSRKKKD